MNEKEGNWIINTRRSGLYCECTFRISLKKTISNINIIVHIHSFTHTFHVIIKCNQIINVCVCVCELDVTNILN
jgi:hypothetical protein